MQQAEEKEAAAFSSYIGCARRKKPYNSN